MITLVTLFARENTQGGLLAEAATTLGLDFAMGSAIQRALFTCFSFPWCFALALARLFVVKGTPIETFLDFACVAENSFEARFAFAFARLLVQSAMAASDNTWIVIHIATIHTSACFGIAFLAIGTVQFALVALVPRPILIGTLAQALPCIPSASCTARIFTLFTLQSNEGVLFFAAATTQLFALFRLFVSENATIQATGVPASFAQWRCAVDRARTGAYGFVWLPAVETHQIAHLAGRTGPGIFALTRVTNLNCAIQTLRAFATVNSMESFVTNALARLGHFAILACASIASLTKSAQPIKWALALACILIHFAMLARGNLGAHTIGIHFRLGIQTFSQSTHLAGLDLASLLSCSLRAGDLGLLSRQLEATALILFCALCTRQIDNALLVRVGSQGPACRQDDIQADARGPS